jgi:hypothetical protein
VVEGSSGGVSADLLRSAFGGAGAAADDMVERRVERGGVAGRVGNSEASRPSPSRPAAPVSAEDQTVLDPKITARANTHREEGTTYVGDQECIKVWSMVRCCLQGTRALGLASQVRWARGS